MKKQPRKLIAILLGLMATLFYALPALATVWIVHVWCGKTLKVSIRGYPGAVSLPVG